MNKIYSHPDKLLKDHLDNVFNIAMSIINEDDILKNFEILRNYDKSKINKHLEYLFRYHDIGKSTVYFQKYLADENIEALNLKNHSLLSAIIVLYNIANNSDLKLLSAVIFKLIKEHHSDLQNILDSFKFGKNKSKILDILDKQLRNTELNEFENLEVSEVKKIDKIIGKLFFFDEEKFDKSLYYLTLYLFSVLIYADKNDAKFSGRFVNIKNISSDIVDLYKKEKFSDSKKNLLNTVREEIYRKSQDKLEDNTDKKIFTLNVPTGGGKTLTGFNLALKLKEKNNLKRIIYVLPYTSIIDQNYNVYKEILERNNYSPEEMLLKHHHLSEVKIKNTERAYEGEEAQFIIENWDKSIIVTTFWQLLNSILTNKNRNLKKFHNISRSVIIFDEVQTIPIYYWKLIKELIYDITHYLKSKVIYMTATMPMIFDNQEESSITNLLSEKYRKKIFSYFSRYEIHKINNLKPIFIEDLIKHVKDKIEKDKNIMVIFNTKKSSKRFYDLIKSYVDNNSLLYLSSNIVPFHRKRRIEKIKNSKKPLFVVTTQLVEAGVDIDFDIVYRDMAPFDSLIQAAGRCNREFRDITGNVYFYKLKDKEQKRYYSTYIYNSTALEPTLDIFSETNTIEEKNLFEITRRFYKNYYSKIRKDKSNKILKNINQCRFEDVQNSFQLIKQIPKELVFVEVSEDAHKVWEKFLKIQNITDPFEKKDEFLKIRNIFYNYVVNVNLNHKNKKLLENFLQIGNIYYLRKDMIGSFYDLETGIGVNIDRFL
ncbi:MAG: CRISPR-associated helicase Cas3' [Candidatus Mcinerneyibacterium aminivorans]|uniref:CRISPR-associated helicase Cas3 n=1 Tax=Candidatus Mcinerneyibacterium aminivorans TaxID=2703815 RepID=A0A5D0M9U0_9BACT|nr:MAG: CRISPR-associated helicase Cas3' [Candidatus Mcinerneyibacterium aminivorans]